MVYAQNDNITCLQSGNRRRTRSLFSTNETEPFKLRRSKTDQFLQCPRCFYLDRNLGVSQPSGVPFTLNNALMHS